MDPAVRAQARLAMNHAKFIYDCIRSTVAFAEQMLRKARMLSNEPAVKAIEFLIKREKEHQEKAIFLYNHAIAVLHTHKDLRNAAVVIDQLQIRVKNLEIEITAFYGTHIYQMASNHLAEIKSSRPDLVPTLPRALTAGVPAPTE